MWQQSTVVVEEPPGRDWDKWKKILETSDLLQYSGLGSPSPVPRLCWFLTIFLLVKKNEIFGAPVSLVTCPRWFSNCGSADSRFLSIHLPLFLSVGISSHLRTQAPVLLEGGWLTVMSSRSGSAKVCQRCGCGWRWWAKEAAGLRYAGGVAVLGAWHGRARQDLSSQRWRRAVPRWHIQLASKHTNTKLQVHLRLPLLSSQQAAPPWAPSFAASPTWTPTQPQTDSRRSCPTKKLPLPPLLSAAAHPRRPS
jgi:hypothetical protein